MFYVFAALVALAEFGFFLYLRRKAQLTALRNEDSKRLCEEALVLEREAREKHKFSTKLALSVDRQVAPAASPDYIN